jgi:LmbE family N-acetylglucosaminyl deacetylase
MMYMHDRYLFISAHPDDSELSAGGLIHKLVRLGKEVRILILSNPVISLPEGFEGNVLIKEQEQAAACLGVALNNIRFCDFPVRRFSEHRQDILETFVEVNKQFNPDVIVTSHPQDIHQDHAQVGQEASRAFKKKNLLFYEAPWNGAPSSNNLSIALEAEDIDAKQAAISCYKSQQHRIYSSPDFLSGWAKMRGAVVDEEFAEVFEVQCLRF